MLTLIQHMLYCLVVLFTSGRSTPKQDILEFCKDCKLPLHYVAEIIIGYIRQNKAVSADFNDLVEILRGYCPLCSSLYSGFIAWQLKHLLDIYIDDTSNSTDDCVWGLFAIEEENTVFTERPTLDELSRYFGEDSSPLPARVQCEQHKSKCSFPKFQYLPHSVPHYNTPADNYHWYIEYGNSTRSAYSLVTGTTYELVDILKNKQWISLFCTKYN